MFKSDLIRLLQRSIKFEGKELEKLEKLFEKQPPSPQLLEIFQKRKVILESQKLYLRELKN